MPMSQDFQDRLNRMLPQIVNLYGTPFHIYDEKGIQETGKRLIKAFNGVRGFREYFAVKANPNLILLAMLKKMGFGFDCSSIPELKMARILGAKPKDIMFTSNNTSLAEFEEAAKNGGCILNLDDVTMTRNVPRMPKLICFRSKP